MKTFLKIAAVVIVLVPVLVFGWLTYSTQKNLASATDEALAALASTAEVAVERDGDWLVMRPATQTPTTGMILYPGANSDTRGYAQVLKAIAAEGYFVVAVSMPFDFAIFAPDSADEVRAAFPGIRNWVIAGHSMGGAMAGLILWDSYPPEAQSLADSSLPIVHIHRALPDGTPAQKFIDNKHLFPASSVWVPIPGGIHMYYGSFNGGGYVEEWEPQISRAEQHERAIAATLDALEWME